MRWAAVLIPIFSLSYASLLISGCNRDSSDLDVPINAPELFSLEADLVDEGDEENYEWTTTLLQPEVAVRVRDFGGTVRIRVYDAAGVEVYDEEYSFGAETDADEDDITDLGTAGVWRIRVNFTDCNGELRLRLQQPNL